MSGGYQYDTAGSSDVLHTWNRRSMDGWRRRAARVARTLLSTRRRASTAACSAASAAARAWKQERHRKRWSQLQATELPPSDPRWFQVWAAWGTRAAVPSADRPAAAAEYACCWLPVTALACHWRPGARHLEIQLSGFHTDNIRALNFGKHRFIRVLSPKSCGGSPHRVRAVNALI